jgi:shikimate kinase / 3-dehydroquinate synthase
MSGSTIFLYGAPGSGKSTIGRILAHTLNLIFYDLDIEIEQECRKPIWKIFAEEGESGFRRREKDMLQRLVQKQPGIVALGGGTLLDEANRATAENTGVVVILNAPLHVLHARINADPNQRPLLAGDLAAKLENLLKVRVDHYKSFEHIIDTEKLDTEQAAWLVQIRLGMFRVKGMGSGKAGSSGEYDVRIRQNGLNTIGHELTVRELNGPIVLVSDDTVGPLYARGVLDSLKNSGFKAAPIFIRTGEEFKTIQTVNLLWDSFLANQLDRSSTVIALGGGVVSDLTGFAAATYLRGIRWVGLPTTLLSMADASLGGKTGADLPEGKNLIGAFHSPALVMADPDTLVTLPERELRSGFGEIVKHGVISDPELFAECKKLAGFTFDEIRRQPLGAIIRRAMAVKIRVIEDDPFEQNIRAILNAGHTIGHAVELASGFKISHGEAVSIGIVVEAQMAEELGIAHHGLAEEISFVLNGLGLPTRIPAGFDQAVIETTIFRDKKRAGGTVKFAFPVEIGKSKFGISLGLEDLRRNHAFSTCFTRP